MIIWNIQEDDEIYNKTKITLQTKIKKYFKKQ